jgi:hypothetical protein
MAGARLPVWLCIWPPVVSLPISPSPTAPPLPPPPAPACAAPYARQLLLEGSSLQDAQLAKMKQQFLKGAKLQVGGWMGG